MSDDLWGEVPCLLQNGKSLLTSSSLKLLFLVYCSLTPFFFSFFAVSDRPLLEEHYQGRIKAALKFVLTVDNFDELVDPCHLSWTQAFYIHFEENFPGREK